MASSNTLQRSAQTRWRAPFGALLAWALSACAATHLAEPDTTDAAAPDEMRTDAGPEPIPSSPREVDAGIGEAPAVTRAAEPALTEETCNGVDDDGDGKRDEGCPHLLAQGTDARLGGGRVVWHRSGDEGQELWTAALSDGQPELLDVGMLLRADADGDRVVYGDYESFGYSLVDMRDGSARLIEPHDPKGFNLLQPRLDGDHLVYAQDLPISCGGWCDETEVFVHDLSTGASHNVAPHARTIQTAPQVSGSYMVWMDDRHGHHRDSYGAEHWFDVMGAALPYAGGHDRLTSVQPRSSELIAFAAGRVLATELSEDESGPLVLDVTTGELVPIEWAVPLGDVPLDLSEAHLLVLHDPPGRCGLRLGRWSDRALLDVDTGGACPDAAQVDGDYVLFTHSPGADVDIYYVDISDL